MHRTFSFARSVGRCITPKPSRQRARRRGTRMRHSQGAPPRPLLDAARSQIGPTDVRSRRARLGSAILLQAGALTCWGSPRAPPVPGGAAEGGLRGPRAGKAGKGAKGTKAAKEASKWPILTRSALAINALTRLANLYGAGDEHKRVAKCAEAAATAMDAVECWPEASDYYRLQADALER